MRPSRSRDPRFALVAAASGVVLGGLTMGLLLGYFASSDSASGGKAAALVDQLSLTQPNPQFAQDTANLLRNAGYRVDYYSGAEVTVDFYRALPKHGYKVIVFRVHTGVTVEVDPGGAETLNEYVSLFTGEPYTAAKYVAERENGLIGEAQPYDPGAEPAGHYFAVTPAFIESAMKGRFDDTLVVMMGCDGLRSERTARAFLDRGVSSVVSWSQPVSASHTDAATLRLLRKIMVDGQPITSAVAETASEVGPDPWYGAQLRVLEGRD